MAIEQIVTKLERRYPRLERVSDDSKIGALFGRKFRFLGERFKQIELA